MFLGDLVYLLWLRDLGFLSFFGLCLNKWGFLAAPGAAEKTDEVMHTRVRPCLVIRGQLNVSSTSIVFLCESVHSGALFSSFDEK